MIKAIIFDCFGVLAEDGWLPFKRQHIGNDAELAEEIADLGKQNEYGMITASEYIDQAAQLMQVDAAELRQATSKRQPNEVLFTLIRELKPRYKIGLMSNANYDVVHELFEPEQAALFDASVLSYESKLVKPDPRMYALMCEKLGVEHEECIYIDDIERYCTAAELLGMETIAYENPTQTQKELAGLLR